MYYDTRNHNSALIVTLANQSGKVCLESYNDYNHYTDFICINDIEYINLAQVCKSLQDFLQKLENVSDRKEYGDKISNILSILK